MIAKVETDILMKLDFRLNYATSLELLSQIMFVDLVGDEKEDSCSDRNLYE
jgi:hypothetical protein